MSEHLKDNIAFDKDDPYGEVGRFDYAFEIVIGGLATLRENFSNIRANVKNIADQASRAIGISD